MKIGSYKILSGSLIKLLAVITMLIDHAALILNGSIGLLNTPLLGDRITLYFIMRKIGRLAFPLFCFLLVEGFLHTKNRKRYGQNLLLFAIISEIPYNLMIRDKVFAFDGQNIYFTLFLGFLALCLIESSLKNVYKALFLLPSVVIIPYLNLDYGLKGFLLIVLLYVMREQKVFRALLSFPLLSGGYPAWCAFVPISMYNGKRGFINNKPLKYCFYVFYPLHIVVLLILKTIIN